MARLRWAVGQVVGWSIAVCLGALGVLALLFALAGAGGFVPGMIVALAVGFGATVGAFLVGRRHLRRPDPSDPVVSALASLPPGAVVRHGRVRKVPWVGLAASLFAAGVVLAVLGLGFGASLGESVFVLAVASAVAGALIGVGYAKRPVTAALNLVLLLPGALLVVVAFIALVGSGSVELAELLGVSLLLAAVTMPPIMAGMVLGRIVRKRLDEGRAAVKGAGLSAGLERALDGGRTAAVAWTYPYGESGQRELATDRRILSALGYDVVLEEHHAPTSPVIALPLLVARIDATDAGSVSVVYRRRALAPGDVGQSTEAFDSVGS